MDPPTTSSSSTPAAQPQPHLPGLTLPIDSRPDHKPFRTAVLGWAPAPVTERERSMLAVINALSDKPDWARKVFDDGVVARWRAEAVHHAPPLRSWNHRTYAPGRQGFDDGMFDFCIAELRDKAAAYASQRFVRVLDTAAAVAKSDDVVAPGLRAELAGAAAALLEDAVPEAAKDWHPSSGGMVLDLVHPSLFPLVYGRSRVLGDGSRTVGLDDCLKVAGCGETVPRPWVEKVWGSWNKVCRYWDKPLWSNHFQWLPCDVAFTEEGKTRIVSYVNNLHPVRHRELYGIVERVMDAAVPLWDEVLGCTGKDGEPDTYLRVRVDEPYYTYHGDRHELSLGWDEDDEDEEDEYDEDDEEDEEDEEDEDDGKVKDDEDNKNNKDDGDDEKDESEEDDGGDESEDDENGEDEPKDRRLVRLEKLDSNRELILPSPKPYGQHNSTHVFKKSKVNLRQQFASEGLQVIVKLANIHLTPEKPDYPGGSWHVEGMRNEWICATAIYYYDCDNVTDSYLGFRQNVDAEELVSKQEWQFDWGGVEFLYGVSQDEGSVQNVGRVLTQEGRLIAFPNVLQHRVEPFSLRDRSKPGHRKILALFLVDPNQRIISTANVPPQRHDWWSEEIANGRLGELPTELTNMIASNVDDWPMGMEEAKELREELMIERRANEAKAEGAVFNELNFCEH